MEEVFEAEYPEEFLVQGKVTAKAHDIWMYRKFYTDTATGQQRKIREELFAGTTILDPTMPNPIPYLKSIATWVKVATVLLGLLVLKFIFS